MIGLVKLFTFGRTQSGAISFESLELGRISLDRQAVDTPVARTRLAVSPTPTFLRVAGKSAEGMYITAVPLLMAEQPKESDSLRAAALAFVRQYEGKHGAGTRNAFAAAAWDTYRLLENAAKIALRKAQPGTEAFRVAMRDGIEQTRDLTTTTLHYAFSENNHSALDHRSQILVMVKGGKWVLAD